MNRHQKVGQAEVTGYLFKRIVLLESLDCRVLGGGKLEKLKVGI